MSKSLKENKIENYYLLNYKWIQEYIKLHQIEKIYKYLKDNKLIESYINKEIEDKILENNFNINEIIYNLDQNLLKNISKPNNYINDLYKNESYKADYSYKTKSKLKKEYLIYYNDFYLISPETKNSFSKESTSNNIKFNIDSFSTFLGDNKIFLIVQTNYSNIIEIGYLNNENVFEPTKFLDHKHDNELKSNIKLLLSNGYNQYQNYYLMFNDDYISPIFDQNNNRIGQAFRYDKNIDDYSKYISREEKMKSLIHLIS